MINLLPSAVSLDEIGEDKLILAAETVLIQSKIDDAVELSIVIGDDEQLRELNQRFLGIDSPTDVLSFPADELDPDTGMRYLGDVIISYQRAEEQAAAANVTIKDELQLLIVHGVLHLLGHDHATPEEKSRMWQKQKQALDALGCKIDRLPE